MSPSPVCLSAEGAKNVSGPWSPPLREWGGRKLRHVWKTYKSSLINFGLSTLGVYLDEGRAHSEALTVAQRKAHCSQFEHFGDSLRTPVAPLMSPSPVCLSAEGAKNVSGPWCPPLWEWGGRKLRHVWKIYKSSLINFGLSTLGVYLNEGRASFWGTHRRTTQSSLFAVWALWWLPKDSSCSVNVSFPGLLVSRGC